MKGSILFTCTELCVYGLCFVTATALIECQRPDEEQL